LLIDILTSDVVPKTGLGLKAIFEVVVFALALDGLEDLENCGLLKTKNVLKCF